MGMYAEWDGWSIKYGGLLADAMEKAGCKPDGGFVDIPYSDVGVVLLHMVNKVQSGKWVEQGMKESYPNSHQVSYQEVIHMQTDLNNILFLMEWHTAHGKEDSITFS